MPSVHQPVLPSRRRLRAVRYLNQIADRISKKKLFAPGDKLPRPGVDEANQEMLAAAEDLRRRARELESRRDPPVRYQRNSQ